MQRFQTESRLEQLLILQGASDELQTPPGALTLVVVEHELSPQAIRLRPLPNSSWGSDACSGRAQAEPAGNSSEAVAVPLVVVEHELSPQAIRLRPLPNSSWDSDACSGRARAEPAGNSSEAVAVPR